MEIKEGDLVSVRIEVPIGYTNIWLRVKFIDLDNTFVGEIERKDMKVAMHVLIGSHERFGIDEVSHVYQKGEEFCYSDYVTVCSCPGVCRNK